MELPTLSTNFIDFRPNCYNLKTLQQQQQQHMIRPFTESYA